MSYQRAEQPVVLKGVEAARAFFAPCMTGSRSGDWWVAHVDERVRCLHLTSYAADEDGLPVGSILGEAVRLGSAGLLLASQRLESGAASEQAAPARHLSRAADALDISLVDHLVFTNTDCTSLRRLGLL